MFIKGGFAYQFNPHIIDNNANDKYNNTVVMNGSFAFQLYFRYIHNSSLLAKFFQLEVIYELSSGKSPLIFTLASLL